MSRYGILCALALMACGDKEVVTDDTDSVVDEDVDAATVPLEGVCDQEVRWGNFVVDSNEDYAAASGQVADGVVPTAVLTNLMSEGGCTIWRRENPFCEAGCESGFTCGLDGICVPYPENQDVGAVTINGMLADVSMDPVTPGYSYFDTSLSNPPWEAGEVVTLRTEGGVFNPVTLHGVAPAYLEVESTEWILEAGEPFTVRWEAAPADSRTEIVLSVRVDQHGLTPSALECVFPDTGEGTMPPEHFEELVRYGLTGFPAGSLTRRTVDHAELDGGGCVQFVASSSRLPHVDVEGYTPCRRDEDCPEGQECNEPLERCE